MGACCCLPWKQPDRREEAVRLNVGGTSFITSRTTLKKCPKLYALASRHEMSDGTVFVDRDARYFLEVLNFLRDGPALFQPPADDDARRALIREAAFFNIPDLAECVREANLGASFPSNEEARIAKLNRLNILDTDGHDFHLNSVVRIVGAILDAPIALVSLVAADRQWNKARVGFHACSISRSSSICAWSLLPEDPREASMLLIEDTTKDPRTTKNRFVKGPPNIKFFLGSPLITSEGLRLGCLSVADTVTRSLTLTQAQSLASFGQLCMQELEREHLLRGGDDFDLEDDGLDFRAGPLRAERMRDALGEVVCLVQTRSDSMEWPILYANRQFSEILDIRITPPEKLSGFAVAEGEGLRHFAAATRTGGQLNLWDWLQLSSTSERRLMRDLAQSWEHMNSCVFSFDATMPALLAQGAGADRVPISCRLSRCDLPIDVATIVAPTLRRTQENLRPAPVKEVRLHFVTMLVPLPTVLIGTDVTQVLEVPSQAPSGDFMPFSSGQAPRIGALGSSNLVPRMKPKKKVMSPFLDIRLVRLVGKGQFGKLYYGLWMGSPVAVKIIANKREQISRIERVFEEALSMSVMHPNIVQIVKSFTRGSQDVGEEDISGHMLEIWVVQEWCDRGTLQTHCQIPRTCETFLPEVMDINLDISSAGSFLHSRGIVHGNLTANNVLINTHMNQKGYICKICDFGIARMLEGNSADFTSTLSTLTYMPPEHFETGKEVKLTAKADIYAAGVLLWQTICGKCPFAGLSPSQVVVAVIKGQRLNLPEDTPSEIRRVFSRCTASDPLLRPTFDELVETFSKAIPVPPDSD